MLRQTSAPDVTMWNATVALAGISGGGSSSNGTIRESPPPTPIPHVSALSSSSLAQTPSGSSISAASSMASLLPSSSSHTLTAAALVNHIGASAFPVSTVSSFSMVNSAPPISDTTTTHATQSWAGMASTTPSSSSTVTTNASTNTTAPASTSLKGPRPDSGGSRSSVVSNDVRASVGGSSIVVIHVMDEARGGKHV